MLSSVYIFRLKHFEKSKSDSESIFNSKLYLITIWNFFLLIISINTKKFKNHTFYIKNLCSSPSQLKGLEGCRPTMIFFWKSHKLILGNTWKIPEAWTIQIFCFIKYFTERVWKNGWKKFTGKVWACASGRSHAISFLMVLFS